MSHMNRVQKEAVGGGVAVNPDHVYFARDRDKYGCFQKCRFAVREVRRLIETTKREINCAQTPLQT